MHHTQLLMRTGQNTTILPWSCTDDRYFYHVSGTTLFSGTNSGFFGTMIFLLHFGYTCQKQEIGFKWKLKKKEGGSGVPRVLRKVY